MVVVGSLAIQSSFAQTPKPSKEITCKTFILRLKRPILAASALAVATFLPSLTYDLYGAARGESHLGHGIYLDINKIESLLPKDDRALLIEPQKNVEKIVEVFNSLLSGDYDNTVTLIPKPREASSYFCGQSNSRGCCRHKAIVFASILRHYGIHANLQIGRSKAGWHMWVYLPDQDLIADPTDGWISSRDEYMAKTFPNRTSHVVLGYDWNNWTLTPFERGWFR